MRLQGLAISAALLSAVSLWQTSSSADVVATMPAPPAMTETTTTTYAGPNRGLVFGGLFMLGAPYIASVIVASESDHPGDNKLYIPVAGPWLDLGQRGDCSSATMNCSNEPMNKAFLIGDGIFQGVGALSLVVGLMVPERHVVHRVVRSADAKPSVRFAPVTYRGGSGLAAFGSF